MSDTTTPADRVAAPPVTSHQGPVTLVNSFVVDADRDETFAALWGDTSAYFRSRPGFVELRLHRAVSPTAGYRFVNVATWASVEQFQQAHATEEFRRLVGQPAWREFPSSPALYEVISAHGPAASIQQA